MGLDNTKIIQSVGRRNRNVLVEGYSFTPILWRGEYLGQFKPDGTFNQYLYRKPNGKFARHGWDQNWQYHGTILAHISQTRPYYAQWYVWVSNQGYCDGCDTVDFENSRLDGAWKKVDFNWPKIDSRTGQEFDQFLNWDSPLAQ